MSNSIELDPDAFGKLLLSCGLSEPEVRQISSEFAKNGNTLDDEVLAGKLLAMGKELYTIISIFNKLGIGSNNIIRMIERQQAEKVGAFADVYNLEVED